MNGYLRQHALGALYGAVMGAELGHRHSGRLPREAGGEALDGDLDWTEAPPVDPHRQWSTSFAPLIAGVAEAFGRRGGRITPEDWAETLKQPGPLTEAKAFWLLDVYSGIELLREGMSPRLTGQHTTLMGAIAAIAGPVGVFHAGDPDAAYVDGMELASVVQRRPATDWAALLASAVSAALMPGGTTASIVAAVLEIADRRAPEVAADLRRILASAREQSDDAFLAHYRAAVTRLEWYGADPLGGALMLLERYGDRPVEMLKAAAQAPYGEVHGPAAGALAGALHGLEAWPEGWREPARPLVEPLEGLLPVVEAKLQRERIIVRELEVALEPGPDGEPALFDRVYGCILAGAIGNAMGSPAEGALYTEVLEQHNGPIATVLYPDRLENEDDNQMAMLLTRTYLRLAGKQVTARDFGETWMSNMRREGFWLCCRSTYDQIKGGLDPRIAGHWNLVTGSTVMCMEPVGVYHFADPANAYLDGTMISYMEQRGLDVTAAAILAGSVAEALRPGATVDSVLQAALEVAPRTKMSTFDERVPDNAHDYLALCMEVAGKYDDVLASFPELYGKCLCYHHIDPLELLGLAYAMFRIADGDVRQAAIGGATIGRDADTICGRAAMLSGTLRGAGTVPAEWIGMFSAPVLANIQQAARDTVTMLGEGKLAGMRERQGGLA